MRFVGMPPTGEYRGRIAGTVRQCPPNRWSRVPDSAPCQGLHRALGIKLRFKTALTVVTIPLGLSGSIGPFDVIRGG